MGRFSPTVVADYGPGLDLAGALDSYLTAKQQRKDQTRQDDQQHMADALQAMQLRREGIHLLGRGEQAPAPELSLPTPTRHPSLAEGLSQSDPLRPNFSQISMGGPQAPDEQAERGMGGPMTPGAFNPMLGTFNPATPVVPSRYEYGQGYYVDRQERAGHQTEEHQARIADLLEAQGIHNAGALDVYAGQKRIDQQYPKPVPPKEPRALTQVDTGGSVLMVDPVTGQRVSSFGKSATPKGPDDPKEPRAATEYQQRASFLYPRASQALTTIRGYMQAHPTGPSNTAKGLSRIGMGSAALSGDDQQFYQATQVAATAIVRLESGANTPESEIQRMVAERTPQIGDKPEVIQQKLATLEADVSRLGELAAPAMRGSAMAPGASVQQPDEFTALYAKHGKTPGGPR